MLKASLEIISLHCREVVEVKDFCKSTNFYGVIHPPMMNYFTGSPIVLSLLSWFISSQSIHNDSLAL